MSFTLNHSANLPRVIRALGDLAQVPSRAAPKAAPKIRKLITKQFTSGTDPRGGAWAPLRPRTLAKGRRPPPLTATRKMRRTIRVRPMAGAGLSISVPAPYAQYHQFGTSRMVARQILPQGSVPPAWVRAFEDAIEETIGRAL